MSLSKSILAILVFSAFTFNAQASIFDLGGGQEPVDMALEPEGPEATPAEIAAELGIAEDAQDLLQPVGRGRVEIEINKRSQRMTVSVDGWTEYTWKVSTARSGYRTPVGSWKPKSLEKMHYSRKYDNSPMPHSIFFLGGYAIHGTDYERNLGKPASHGCIRLSKSNARTLFYLVKEYGMANTVISIY